MTDSIKTACEIFRCQGLSGLSSLTVHVLKRKINRYFLELKYNSKVVPTRTSSYEVQPSDINSYIRWNTVRQYFGGEIPAGPVWSGEWDKLETQTITQSCIYRSFVDRFKKEKRWEETEYYKRLFTDQKNKFETETLSNLKKYDALYKDIKLNGYNEEFPIRTLVTRDGDYIIWDGKHRAAIAKLLGLNSLIINIRAIHRSWLERRSDVYNNRLPKERKEPPSHPDLQNILN